MPPKRPPPPDDADSTNKRSSGRKRAAVAAPSAAAKTTNAHKVTLVTQLGPYDVLMGRGALATDYEGNLRLREMVRTRQDEYIRTPKRNRKHQISEEVVHMLKARGGRFLQGAETLQNIDPKMLPKHEAAWFVVEDMAVITSKVKQLLRDVKPNRSNSLNHSSPESKPPGEIRVAVPFNGTGGLLPLVTTDTSTSTRQPNTSPTVSSVQGAQSESSHPSAASHSRVDAHQARAQEQQMAQIQRFLQNPPQASGQTQSQTQESQRHAAVSLSTSNSGQDNASAVLRALLMNQASHDQQPNGLLAFTLASRLHSESNGALAAQATPNETATISATQPDPRTMAQVIATMLDQYQQRSRERATTNDLLARLIMPQTGPAAPLPAVPPQSDPSVTALIDQLQAHAHPSFPSTSTSAATPSSIAPVVPALAPNLPPELAALLDRAASQIPTEPQGQAPRTTSHNAPSEYLSSSIGNIRAQLPLNNLNTGSPAPFLSPALTALLGGGATAAQPSLSIRNAAVLPQNPSSSLLEELETLLPPQYRQPQQTQGQQQQQNNQGGDPRRGLEELLRSLQNQGFPPPS